MNKEFTKTCEEINKDNATIHITIGGITNTGKSAIAFATQQLLVDNGIASRISKDEEIPTVDWLSFIVNKMKAKTMGTFLKDVRVLISTQQFNRDGEDLRVDKFKYDKAIEGLKKLASSEAFVLPKTINEEERERLLYAEQVLKELGEDK